MALIHQWKSKRRASDLGGQEYGVSAGLNQEIKPG